MSKVKRPAIFLDRDGTINVDTGYPDSPEKIILIPKAIDAVKLFNKLGFLVIVVSNQSGVARGYFDCTTVEKINDWMQAHFAEQGATIDQFYYCPYLPDAPLEKYRKDAECRKPAPGMLLQAAKDFEIDLESSYIIGDKYSDIGAGKAVGATSILVYTGEGEKQHQKNKADKNLPQPDMIAKDIWAAGEMLKDL